MDVGFGRVKDVTAEFVEISSVTMDMLTEFTVPYPG
jgi:hypothetical protein